MPRCKHCGRDKDNAYRAVSYYCAPPFARQMHDFGEEQMIFEEQPRKVHLHFDQQGATFGLKNTPFANTLCKMNSAVPDSHITTDPDKVTCKICRKDHRFKAIQNGRFGKLGNINEMYGKMATPYPLHMQMFGRALRPGWLNGKRTRYRRNWLGQLILQVADEVPVNYDPADPYETRSLDDVHHTGRWRDATLADLGGGVV